ncbi:MAG: nitrite reductase, copper-containing [Chloroflexi bacterium]|nr:nitrite reductase, copper-containing [Chloroflexota bacterium]
MAVAAALVIAAVGATGGIRAVTIVAPAAPANGGAAAATATEAKPAALAAAKTTTVKAIGASAAAVPAPITRTAPATVTVDFQTKEVVAEVAPGETYTYWTFNGTVPGPMVRVRVGDTVKLKVANATGSVFPHSIDLHAVNGPGGGATATQTPPGKETTVSFKALNPGLYVYHCATGPIPQHIANGMYGLILVEPEGGFAKVDREFMVVQGELYTNAPRGTTGHHEYDHKKLLDERPDYVVLNGSVGAITGNDAMKATVGETVRIFFGVGGFLPSSLHLIGEIFDKVYPEAGGVANTNVQTTFVPAGGATIVEFKLDVPGTYALVDHSLGRALDKGAAAHLVVTGAEDHTIYGGAATGAGH